MWEKHEEKSEVNLSDLINLNFSIFNYDYYHDEKNTFYYLNKSTGQTGKVSEINIFYPLLIEKISQNTVQLN